MPDHDQPASTNCPSCLAPRRGRYCAECGELFLRPEDAHLRHFLATHVFHELFEFDGKVARTLRIVFTRPGQLAVDYVAGRRKRFVSPLRLCLVTFLLHAFLTAALAPHQLSLPERVREVDPTGWLTRLLAAHNSVDWSNPELSYRLTERSHWMAEFGTLLIFFAVAGILSLIVHRPRRPYLDHLALALSVSAFLLTVLILGDGTFAIVRRADMIDLSYQLNQVLGLVALPIYWYLAIRRFYGMPRLTALGTTLLVSAGNILIAGVFNFLMQALLIETA